MNYKNEIELSFHEDDYKMIELISNRNYFSTNKGLETLKEGNDLYDELSSGFKSINIIPKHTVSLVSEKIYLSEVEKILNSISQNRTSNIKKGYSNTYSKIEGVKAWGFEYSVIFVEHNKKYVESIWLLEIGEDIVIEDDKGEKLRKVLFELGKIFKLILVDWNKEILVNISKENQVINYLREELNYNL